MNTTETIQTAPAVQEKSTTPKKTLTLIVAIFFLITAIVPIVLLLIPTPAVDNMEHPAVITNSETPLNMTAEQKFQEVAGALEKTFYPPYKESTLLSEEEVQVKEANRKEFFLIGTKVMFATLVASSLLMSAAFFIMYRRCKLSYNIRSTVMLVCVTLAVAGALIMAIMHIYSIVVLINRLPSIATNMNLTDQKARDACTTETVYYLLRNLLVTAGLAHYLYTLPMFAFSSELNKASKKKKLTKASKKLYGAYTSVALVCSYYAIIIALTWTFNFTTKALLGILALMAISSFVMIGFVYDFHKELKKSSSKEVLQAETEVQPSNL
ncbi:MAG: hypothetical protein IKB72_00185 [Ruminococcus sp.]|nr:hypothetical protein [Ruminococcus sp.]